MNIEQKIGEVDFGLCANISLEVAYDLRFSENETSLWIARDFGRSRVSLKIAKEHPTGRELKYMMGEKTSPQEFRRFVDSIILEKLSVNEFQRLIFDTYQDGVLDGLTQIRQDIKKALGI